MLSEWYVATRQKFSETTDMINWVPSLEELAADPEAGEAPVVGMQVEDFDTLPDSMTEPFVKRGMGAQVYNYSVEYQNNGMVGADPFADAHEGQLLSVVDKWPTSLEIPSGGNVVATDLDEDTITAIKEEGYRVYPSVESFAEKVAQDLAEGKVLLKAKDLWK